VSSTGGAGFTRNVTVCLANETSPTSRPRISDSRPPGEQETWQGADRRTGALLLQVPRRETPNPGHLSTTNEPTADSIVPSTSCLEMTTALVKWRCLLTSRREHVESPPFVLGSLSVSRPASRHGSPRPAPPTPPGRAPNSPLRSARLKASPLPA
jgi:hypothetical protein